ncbi:YehS family protein [Pseudoalteromonas aurantia]|uniref:DUF1456 domain-containing protein n=1 Tax=Pseudoalteromonas aurantia 208 TaxID=1314867 RepID=A0ABR9ECD9_9GAMM|nr:DUF1456 family protein [Pseudoalteromonas aurantia]MBE0368634.1 hypothetical protein [Pseudoalteromonas aurantia 208]
MNNNDVLRRVRYTFDLSDSQVIEVFSLTGVKVTNEQVRSWLKQDAAEGFTVLADLELSSFLNGFIDLKRGKRAGEQAKPENSLNNNMIFQKLRIALNLKAEDILDLLQLVDVQMSKHELSAFFRKPGNKHYRVCKDQMLHHFLQALQCQFNPSVDNVE